MPNQQTHTIDPHTLPETITRYLAAHQAHDTATALTAFTSDATVTDDGNTYKGATAIEQWLNHVATAYTYTTELTGAQQTDPTHYTATHHLEGNFPGGSIDLHYRFTLHNNQIQHLIIEP
ncbi:nuclear transport factor 2 family protein [Streptomyces antibioticus]|uniref:nuclear transport factor 2 family protein n=1 Tax=Streptomyces antibioticus TaxID=1890 RepID=UPI0036A81C2A